MRVTLTLLKSFVADDFVAPSNHVPPEHSVLLEDTRSSAVELSDSEDDIVLAHYRTTHSSERERV